MQSCLITLKSSTYSMKAQLLLSKNSIPSKQVKLDGEYRGRGCTHGIRIDCRHRRQVEKLLRDNGVPYSDIIST